MCVSLMNARVVRWWTLGVYKLLCASMHRAESSDTTPSMTSLPVRLSLPGSLSARNCRVSLLMTSEGPTASLLFRGRQGKLWHRLCMRLPISLSLVLFCTILEILQVFCAPDRQGDVLGIDRHGVHSWRRLRLLDMLRRERERDPTPISPCFRGCSRWNRLTMLGSARACALR